LLVYLTVDFGIRRYCEPIGGRRGPGNGPSVGTL
jgi:hypothetical protein